MMVVKKKRGFQMPSGRIFAHVAHDHHAREHGEQADDHIDQLEVTIGKPQNHDATLHLSVWNAGMTCSPKRRIDAISARGSWRRSGLAEQVPARRARDSRPPGSRTRLGEP